MVHTGTLYSSGESPPTTNPTPLSVMEANLVRFVRFSGYAESVRNWNMFFYLQINWKVGLRGKNSPLLGSQDPLCKTIISQIKLSSFNSKERAMRVKRKVLPNENTNWNINNSRFFYHWAVSTLKVLLNSKNGSWYLRNVKTVSCKEDQMAIHFLSFWDSSCLQDSSLHLMFICRERLSDWSSNSGGGGGGGGVGATLEYWSHVR